MPWDAVIVCGHLSIDRINFLQSITRLRYHLGYTRDPPRDLATWEALCYARLKLPRHIRYEPDDLAVVSISEAALADLGHILGIKSIAAVSCAPIVRLRHPVFICSSSAYR